MAGEIVLIIEDDAHIGGLVAQVLRDVGYAPAHVRDVSAANVWRDQGGRPDAIISDLMVPGSSGPHRLPAQLAAMFPSVPVTIMTGVPPRRRAALGVTHDRVLEKPFEIEALLAEVHGMLAARGG
jgi:DNA-binding response OmpR family regulator